MNVYFSPTFLKAYRKCPEKIQTQFNIRLVLFKANLHHPLLKNHPLKGNWQYCWSINVTGDWRAIYKENKRLGRYEFLIIGTHSQLY